MKKILLPIIAALLFAGCGEDAGGGNTPAQEAKKEMDARLIGGTWYEYDNDGKPGAQDFFFKENGNLGNMYDINLMNRAYLIPMYPDFVTVYTRGEIVYLENGTPLIKYRFLDVSDVDAAYLSYVEVWGEHIEDIFKQTKYANLKSAAEKGDLMVWSVYGWKPPYYDNGCGFPALKDEWKYIHVRGDYLLYE
jgi:hypothetical protein